jgi:hypothetical protein
MVQITLSLPMHEYDMQVQQLQDELFMVYMVQLGSVQEQESSTTKYYWRAPWSAGNQKPYA